MPIVCISEGLWVNIACSRSHFANTQCEAVRGRKTTLLGSSNMKLTYTFTTVMPIVGISEGLGVNIACSRSHFANT